MKDLEFSLPLYAALTLINEMYQCLLFNVENDTDRLELRTDSFGSMTLFYDHCRVAKFRREFSNTNTTTFQYFKSTASKLPGLRDQSFEIYSESTVRIETSRTRPLNPRPSHSRPRTSGEVISHLAEGIVAGAIRDLHIKHRW